MSARNPQPAPLPCIECNGTGYGPGGYWARCERCDATGQEPCINCGEPAIQMRAGAEPVCSDLCAEEAV